MTALVNVLGQRKVLRKPSAGIMHATIFWGFLIITIGTAEQFLTPIYAPWDFQFVGHAVYGAFVFIYDIFTLAVLVAVIYAFYRRLSGRKGSPRQATPTSS